MISAFDASLMFHPNKGNDSVKNLRVLISRDNTVKNRNLLHSKDDQK